MATNEKRYPFSAAKHAHDIEFYHNHLWNVARDMESGEIPLDEARYDRITAMLEGELRELQYEFIGCRPVVYLTGKQISLAKKIVVWASEKRTASCIKRGRYDLIKYC